MLRAAICDVADAIEITLEANPGTIERGRFAEYRGGGRQSRLARRAELRCTAALKALGRIHSPDETRPGRRGAARRGACEFQSRSHVRAARTDARRSASRDLEQALALEPAHVSHYQLTIEPGTVFAASPPSLPDDDSWQRHARRVRRALWPKPVSSNTKCPAYARPGAALRAQSQLLDFRRLPRRRRRRARQAHTWRPARSCAPRSCASRAAISLQIRARSNTKAVEPADLPFEFMLNALRLVEGFERGTFDEPHRPRLGNRRSHHRSSWSGVS